MTAKRKPLFVQSTLMALLALAACIALAAGSAWGYPRYPDDGAEQNASGGWDLPKSTAVDPKGLDLAGIGWCSPDPTKLTRPECLALRISAGNSAACTAAGGSWTTSAVCNDPARTDQASCEAAPGRLWNADTGICAVTMKGRNRNNAVCLDSGGVWAAGSPGTCTGSWTMPARDTYTPALYTGTGPGDQCLRCHNSLTEWNSNRIRDVESFLLHGHKNMARKVTPGVPWAGPSGDVYPADSSGNVFDWVLGTVGGDPLFWIYGDWLTPLPRTFSQSSTSYTCGRCHMTGWDTSTASTREPELSFPGIRTGRTITGSWNQYGITCSRCHEHAVYDFATAGTPQGSCSVANFFDQASCETAGGTWTPSSYPETAPVAALGYNTHHNDLTQFDAVNGGYCTDNRFRNLTKEQCLFWGGTWFSVCSDDSGWRTQAQCEATAGCSNPAFTTQATCEAGGMCSNPYYTAQLPCETAGGTWTSPNTWFTKTPGTWTAPSCSIAAVCNKGGACSDPAYADKWSCEDAGKTWSTPADSAACTAIGGTMVSLTNLFSCMDAGGKWTGTRERRGQLITALCMNCHRQETGGNPYDPINPGTVLKVGPAHGTVGFVSHPHGNMFLNSPHGKFTGTFAQIGTATLGDGYDSDFLEHGEAANTGNGCTGCHNVHASIVEEAGQHEHAFHEDCADCHSNPEEAGEVPQVDLAQILHAGGVGTPLEHMGDEPSEPCHICHMPHELHLWRINTSAVYSTYPPAALTGTTNANKEPDGTYTNAVWVDVDLACGQCHGGGSTHADTTADTTAGSKVITVASATGFAAGARVKIAGAGDLEADGVTRGDLETYVASVAGTSVTLAMGSSSIPVTLDDTAVELNPLKNGASYKTKAMLASKAAGIHTGVPAVPTYVTFSYALEPSNTLKVNMNAAASTCSGSNANCDEYVWDCGGGTLSGSGVTASCTYATEGAKSISLTVKEYGTSGGSTSKIVNVYAPDPPPVVDGTCTWDANTWTMTVTDSSTDAPPGSIRQVTVNWGDGLKTSDTEAAPFGPDDCSGTPCFKHTYRNRASSDVGGQYTITHKAIDSNGQGDTRTCTAAPAFFTLSGYVYQSDGSTGVPAAVVQVKKDGATVKAVYTAADGYYEAGSLKPGAYTLSVTKPGYDFGAAPQVSTSVGPSGTHTITAVSP